MRDAALAAGQASARRCRQPARIAHVNPRPAADLFDTQMLTRCIELSRQATREGENPFACIICDGDRIVAETTTRAARDGDITRHAEILAISAAQRTLGTKSLAQCTIYCNVEPCAMCSFCIRETNIRRVIYSIASPVMGGLSKWNILGDTDISDALPEIFQPPPEVVGGVLEAEAEQVWREWHPFDWAILRQRRAMGNHDGAAPVAATDSALVSARRSFWRTLRAWFGDDHARPPGKR
jgi:tRNA(adenine34) deaminase